MNTSLITAVVASAPHVTNFCGVFALDNFMEAFLKDPTGAYIFNTHTSDKPGEHWLATIDVGGTVYFFDSYGLTKKRFPTIINFLTNNCPRLRLAGSICLQGFGSTTCGDYCVLFVLLTMRGWSCNKFYTNMSFANNSHDRDHQIRTFIIHLTDVFGVSLANHSLENIHVQQVQPFCIA